MLMYTVLHLSIHGRSKCSNTFCSRHKASVAFNAFCIDLLLKGFVWDCLDSNNSYGKND